MELGVELELDINLTDDGEPSEESTMSTNLAALSLGIRHHHSSLHPRRKGSYHSVRSVLKHEAGGVGG